MSELGILALLCALLGAATLTIALPVSRLSRWRGWASPLKARLLCLGGAAALVALAIGVTVAVTSDEATDIFGWLKGFALLTITGFLTATLLSARSLWRLRGRQWFDGDRDVFR